MSTNTQTHYLLAKAQHKETLRRIRRRHQQLNVQACVALEEAAINFMRSTPTMVQLTIYRSNVEFIAYEQGQMIAQASMPKRLRARIAAFERDFVVPFTDLFPVMRKLRIERTSPNTLEIKRKWA